MKRLLLTFACLGCLLNNAGAQSFLYEAKLGNISGSSLHRVNLPPDCRQYMRADLSDVRIYDSVNREIPYYAMREPQLKAKSDFIPYAILSQKHLKNYSEIVIHNPDKNRIGNIAFNINNSDAHKLCSVEGSDDQKQWYSISAAQELSLAYHGDYANSYKCIYFPFSNYAYFRLLIEDWDAQPLKINSAGYFKNSFTAGRLNDIAFSKTILNQPKNKTTLVQLQFKGPQQADRLDLKIGSPRLFKRRAVIYANRQRQLKQGTENYLQPLLELELSSDKLDQDRSLFLDLPQLSEKELIVEIENKDNPPLELQQIACKQLATFLLCDLAAGNSYVLKCGNDSLPAPEYDLSSFVPENPQAFPEASLGAVQKTRIAAPVPAAPSFFETPVFLWLCLAVGALVILFFSQSLLKDLRKKNEA